MKKKDLWVYMIILIMAGFVSSCQISDDELGEDLLPPGDDVFLYHDTIIDIHSYPITAKPIVTSERYFEYDRVLLMGNLQDTIVGSSKASMITQFNTVPSFKNGPNMEIDSMVLYLHIQDYVGNMDQEITVRVYESTQRTYIDSGYYSNFNLEGSYNPIPLVEKSFLPEDATTLELLIEDQDFHNKFLAVESDTAMFNNDSIFKDYFNGLYIEAESASPEGTMARVHLANTSTKLSLKYATDSTQVDSIEGTEYRWAHFTIDQFFSQKINIFDHDFSGTYLSEIIDNDSTSSPYSYVQGMTGVNTRFSFNSLEEWIAKTPIAINSANLVFEVVPEEESGILYDDLPDRFMIKTIMEDGTYEPIYDYFVLASNNQTIGFGGIKKTESEGMFSDTTYTYRFNMGLHFQYLLDGLKTDNDFVLQLYEMDINPRISKLWSNLSGDRKRIRLEIVYLKL